MAATSSGRSLSRRGAGALRPIRCLNAETTFPLSGSSHDVLSTMRYLAVVASAHLPSNVTSTDVTAAPSPGRLVAARDSERSEKRRTCPSADPTTQRPSPAVARQEKRVPRRSPCLRPTPRPGKKQTPRKRERNYRRRLPWSACPISRAGWPPVPGRSTARRAARRGSRSPGRPWAPRRRPFEAPLRDDACRSRCRRRGGGPGARPTAPPAASRGASAASSPA